MIRRVIAGLCVGALLGAALVSLRALGMPSVQPQVAPIEAIGIDGDAVARRLAAALRFKTVSYQDSKLADPGEFERFNAFLAATYPSMHSQLERSAVAGLSSLYLWKGSASAAGRGDAEEGAGDNAAAGGVAEDGRAASADAALLLLSHCDVVPVEASSEGLWQRAPFGGEIAGGFIWGRGSLDNKASLIASMEALEYLSSRGFKPRRDVYFAFGHDEELGGHAGATAIAALLEQRGVKVDFVLDEGLALTENIIPGIETPVALIGIAEKGYVSLRLSVKGRGGHSSMPPSPTTVGILARALHRLEGHPMPARIDGPVAAMFSALAPEAGFLTRVVFANRGLFSPILLRRLGARPTSNAMIRTTAAPTILSAGIKENVLPEEVHAVVNFRLHPRDSSAAVIEHINSVIDDERVSVAPLGPMIEPSAVSSVNSPAYRALAETVREVFPGVLVAPSMVLGGTDSRHFARVAQDTYRFLPYYIRPDDIPRLHGSNERLPVSDFADAVRFYVRLISKVAG